MSSATPKIGQIFWSDVSAKDADTLKDFYKEIFGWKEHAVKMKDENGTEYNDYAMMIDEETAAGGVCHKKGVNQHIPSQWIMYVLVEDVEASLDKCLKLGGSLVHESRKKDGTLNYVIVKDPEGHIFGFGKI